MRHLTTALATITLAVGAGALAPATGAAQVASATATPEAGVEARLERFNQFLNLTAEQQNAVRPILAAEQQKLASLAQRGGSQEQKVQALLGIGNETEKKVKALLTPEQQKLYVTARSNLKPQLPAAALGS